MAQLWLESVRCGAVADGHELSLHTPLHSYHDVDALAQALHHPDYEEGVVLLMTTSPNSLVVARNGWYSLETTSVP